MEPDTPPPDTPGTGAADPGAELLALSQNLWSSALGFAERLLSPGWTLYQVLILLGLALLAWALGRSTGRMLERTVRARRGWKAWQLRGIIQVRQRLGLAWFVLLSWLVWAVMQQVTWPSRSYLIELAAMIASAWLLIAFATRLVRNKFLRRLVLWGLWATATLFFLGLLEPVTGFLDSLAITLGDMRLSVLSLLKGLVAVGILVTLARIFSTQASASLRRNEDISPSMQVLAVKAVQITAYGLAILLGIQAVGLDLTGLAVLSGAIGVGLGFGLQKVVSNLVSGVIILLDKSIKPGDVISLGDTFGWINALGARYVSITTRDGKEYLIPNEDLITGQVVNWSHSNDFVRLDIYFGTAYGDDPHEVRRLAIAATTGVDRVLESRPPVCHIVGFGDSSVDYILRFWISDPTGGLTNIRGNVYLALWDAFQAHGISIPFPQREVRMLEDQPPHEV